ATLRSGCDRDLHAARAPAKQLSQGLVTGDVGSVSRLPELDEQQLERVKLTLGELSPQAGQLSPQVVELSPQVVQLSPALVAVILLRSPDGLLCGPDGPLRGLDVALQLLTPQAAHFRLGD